MDDADYVDFEEADSSSPENEGAFSILDILRSTARPDANQGATAQRY